MKNASTVKENGEMVTRIGHYGEVGIAYLMDDGTLYKTAGCWAEEADAKRVIRDGGEHYRNEVNSTNAPATLKS